MKFRAHRDVVAACTRQAEGHARCNRGLPRFRVTRRHPQVALETVCAIAAIVIDRLAALTVRGRIKPLAGRSKALLVGHTATPEGSPAAARAGRESASWTSGSRRVRTTAHEMRALCEVGPFLEHLPPNTAARFQRVVLHILYTCPNMYIYGRNSIGIPCGRRARFSAIARAFRFRASYRYASSSPRSAVQTHR